MKKYIAFLNGSNSGIQTREKAQQWAADILGQGKVSCVHVAEVIEVIERAVPIVTMKQFFVATDEPTLKTVAF